MNKAQSGRIRQYLCWSWDYGIAEDLSEETTKGVARAISWGINRGAGQDDGDLIADFIDRRCTDGEIDEDWLPETLVDHAPLRKMIAAQMVDVEEFNKTILP